jgi:hypothetical protein
MTTIIFDKERIIYDSRATIGDKILSDNVEKHYVINEVHFWLLGFFDLAKDMAHAYINKDISDLRLAGADELETMIIVLEKDGSLWTVTYDYDDKNNVVEYKDRIIVPQWAWGTGADLAIGAMTAGTHGYGAMLAVVKRDLYTGGKIKTFSMITRKVEE